MPSTNQSIVINAGIPQIWSRLNDFHDMSWAPNVIKQLEKVGDVPGTEVGAKRVLNDVFHETLIECNENNYHLRYSIDEGPSPVSDKEVDNYIGTVQLTQVSGGEGVKVDWNSSWEADDERAVEFCHNIYVALLRELKSAAEST